MNTQRLIVSGLATGFTVVALMWFAGVIGADPLPAGKTAPDFALKDQDGRERALASARGRYVALAFYPADMTAGCTLEARSLRDGIGALEKRGVQVFGISVQDVESKRAFCDKESLNYPVLADVGGKVADAYGVKMPAGLAKRVTFVIDPKGQIAKVIDNVDVQAHANQILTALGDGSQAPADTTAIGKPVRDAYLPKADDGKMLSLYGSGKQKATVAVFVSTGCPVSRAYEGRLSSLAKEFGERVRFVAVDANHSESAEEIASHFKRVGLSIPVARDAGNVLADRLRAQVTPEAFLLDSSGVLRYHGRIDDSQNPSNVRSNDLREAIQAVLAGRTVANAERMAVGCCIEREKK